MVAANTLLIASSDPDGATHAALRNVGVDEAAWQGFQQGGGAVSLRPIAARFGPVALTELLRRLRYRPDQLVDPPHTYASASDVTRQLGVAGTPALLAPRLLLAIPGHFRELARQAPTAQEAHTLEDLGWLLMRSLRDRLRQAVGVNWWLPAPPPFVTAFAAPPPASSPAVRQLIVDSGVVDASVGPAADAGAFDRWDRGPAGAAWRSETGRSGHGPVVAAPPAVDLSGPQQQVQQAWQQWLADVDQRFPQDPAAQTRALTRCTPGRLPAGLIQLASTRGVALVLNAPALVGEPLVTRLSVLGTLQPLFERLFQALLQLGWNDLLFQTGGAACFRGTRLPPDPTDPQRQYQAARTMSNHSAGTAADFQTFENPQGEGGSMDLRLVGLFEAFGFRWGRCFPVPDPMHFEYCGSACS